MVDKFVINIWTMASTKSNQFSHHRFVWHPSPAAAGGGEIITMSRRRLVTLHRPISAVTSAQQKSAVPENERRS
jgi:hypothetical protein